MTTTLLLAAVTLLLAAAGIVEYRLHRRRLRAIPIRIHVNGTRGKSSVTRLVAAALREAGRVTCAKTTGTLARMIMPDGREVPIFRPAGPNVIEQKRVVAAAAAHGAQALVIECMALQPELQALSELRLIRATHTIITNARPDHLDVMGPTASDVARALAGTISPRGKLYTAEREQLAILRSAAEDRRAELVALGPVDAAAISDEELAGFRYTEHADNVALALRVCKDLGVAREVALRGMWKADPDPGALTRCELDFFGRRIVFFNAFAANDPVSSRQLWSLAYQQHPEAEARVAIVNCRADRPERSVQLGTDLCRWAPADHVLLMGSGTYLFARAATRAGLEPARLVRAEGLTVEEIFETIVALCGRSALVVGIGNIGGQGLALARFFANRALVAQTRPAPSTPAEA
jgi:poly-gamma-glutamate synthase PgsB/CapB